MVLHTDAAIPFARLCSPQLLSSAKRAAHMVQEGHQVDGVLGFSQGATLASLLCTDMGARLAKWRPR